MAGKPGSFSAEELQQFLEVTRRVLGRATSSVDHDLGLLAGVPGAASPYVDTRALAAAVVTFSELGDLQSARALASRLAMLQLASGAWSDTYDPEGRELGVRSAEDATALAVWGLMSYVRSSGDDAFAELVRDRAEEALRYTRARTLNPYIHLVETSESIHGDESARGYELWNNSAHSAAFALCYRVYGGEHFRRLALLIRRSIGLHLAAEGRYIRRLDPNGLPDPRADVVLLAPYYFSLWPATERAVMNSAEFVERMLWNVEIGGYCRLLPFSTLERRSLFGPVPLFSAWMAQYHYELGNKDRAEAMVRWLFDNAGDGGLADVLVPSVMLRRYLPEVRRGPHGAEPPSGDLNPRWRVLYDELETYDDAANHAATVPFGRPQVWAHLETLRALRRGGHIERWELGPVQAGATGEEPGA